MHDIRLFRLNRYFIYYLTIQILNFHIQIVSSDHAFQYCIRRIINNREVDFGCRLIVKNDSTFPESVSIKRPHEQESQISFYPK